MAAVLCGACAEQNYISRKSTQLRDNLKRSKSANKLLDQGKTQPDHIVVVGNGSATIDDRQVK